MSNQHPTTTDAGCPVASDEYSLTVAANGPVLLQDAYLIESWRTSFASAFPIACTTSRAAARSAISR